MEPADVDDFEAFREHPVYRPFLCGIDEGIDVYRHARPDVKRKRAGTADDVTHVVGLEDVHELGEHALHGGAVRLYEQLERVHAPLWRMTGGSYAKSLT